MQINGISHYKAQEIKARRVSGPSPKKGPARKDEYIPASSARSLALESIKAKIRSGHYSSDRVADDISDKLARLFENE